MNVLMIDDHPTQLEGYKAILEYNEMGLSIKATKATDTKTAYDIITNPEKYPLFDIVFLDIGMPKYEEKNINSGEDLGLLIKAYSPDSRIIIITSYFEGLILYELLQSIEPRGILVKSDFDGEDLLDAFKKVYLGETYYSETVVKAKNIITSNSNFLDSINRKIILLLAQGIKTKDLTKHIDLSISAIEKRKIAIKEYFDIDKSSQDDILNKARELGLV
ncbi:response regulator [Flavobacteriaceae bacterium 14752]|uniref:response regulator n=1 Tax=Mesohalobacter salilacus TaxID=2491711 RepID=UPI000F62E478|nr:DNA-binding response regulator [Flavobacteriaceae bacterium 14752]